MVATRVSGKIFRVVPDSIEGNILDYQLRQVVGQARSVDMSLDILEAKLRQTFFDVAGEELEKRRIVGE